MNLKTFFEKFDTFADAPNAVAKMRELVLGLAIQGKLVEQDPREGEAAALVDLATSTRNDLVAEKKLRKPRKIQAVAEFERGTIPKNWTWTTLSEITEIGPRNDVEDSWEAGFLPMPTIPQQYGGDLSPETRKWSEIKKGFTHLADGDIALAKITPCFQNGKSSVIRGLANGVGAGTTELHVARPFAPVLDPFYVWIFLSSPQFIKEGIPHMTGSAGQKRVPTGYFALKPIPLPPLAEQKRIVAKVDALMALCDQLEAQQQARDTQQTALARASLARFADAPTPANLNFLFNSSFKIQPSDLRKSILTLAVQGKLVPQDPGDEPAEELLPKAAAQKSSLQAAGEIPKERPIPPLNEDSTPFDLPETWRWVRLATVTELITKGSSPKWQGVTYVDKSEGILFVTSENVGNYKLRKMDDPKYVERKFNEIEPRSILKFGDILMNLVGASIGRTAIYDLQNEANINQAVALIRLIRSTKVALPSFLLHYFNSPAGVEHMLSSRVTSAQPNISLTDARNFPIPIPPLAEQRRIVAKVDQLMALVDELETQLAESRAAAQKLLEALVAELTAERNLG